MKITLPRTSLKDWTTIAFCMASLSVANAATLTWDPQQTGNGSNGSGAWNNSEANWANGGLDNAYTASQNVSVTVNATTGQTTLTVANVAGLYVGQYITDNTSRFAVGTQITGIDPITKTITLSTGLAANVAAGAVLFGAGDGVVFGGGSGSGGTVTVSGTQTADSMTINATGDGTPYTFTGGTILLGLRNGSGGTLNVNASATIQSVFNAPKGIYFGASNVTLTLSGGGLSTYYAFGVEVKGTGTGATAAANAKTATLKIAGGAYTAGNVSFNIGDYAAETGGFVMTSGTITSGGTVAFGYGQDGFARLTGDSVINNNATGWIAVGRGQKGTMVVDGGTINQTANSNTNIAFGIGAGGSGVGILDVRSGLVSVIGNGFTQDGGGVMVLNSSNTTTPGGSGTLKISGGTVVVKDLRLNGGGTQSAAAASNGSSTVLMTGGALYVGGKVGDNGFGGKDGGFNNAGTGTSTYSVTLSGGVVGANADWSSNLNMTLATINGNITFKAADQSNAARNITLNGILSGAGGFTKSGGGTLHLGGKNTFKGNTVINSGALVLDDTGGFTFTLGASGVNNSITVATGASLSINGTFTFDLSSAAASGQWAIVNATSFDGIFGSSFSITGWNNVGDGTWTYNQYSFNQQTGILESIPEPSSLVFFGMSMAGLVIGSRRKALKASLAKGN